MGHFILSYYLLSSFIFYSCFILGAKTEIKPEDEQEPPTSGRKQKKKKKRLLGKHNKTAPIGGDEDEPQETQAAPGLQSKSVLPPPTGWGTPPLGQRNMYHRPSSRSPRLPSLEEPNEDESRFSKYGLVDELPELNSSSRRHRPNSDYDDDIMT